MTPQYFKNKSLSMRVKRISSKNQVFWNWFSQNPVFHWTLFISFFPTLFLFYRN